MVGGNQLGDAQMTVIYEKMVGKNGVRLKEEYGLSIMVTTNGWQWTGAPVNLETLGMLKEAIAALEAL